MIEYWKTFKIKGKFWDPLNTGIFKLGELEYNPKKGITLFLDEKLKQYNNFNLNILHGELLNGKSVTLQNLNIVSIGPLINSPVIYLVERIFYNALIDDFRNCNISSLELTPSYIFEWINLSGLNLENYIEDGPNNFFIQYNKPEAIKFELSENYEFEIGTSYEGLTFKQIQIDFYLKQVGYIILRTIKEKENILQIIEKMKNILSFFSFATSTLVYSNVFICYLEKGKSNYIEVLEAPFAEEPSDQTNTYSMLFTYHEIEDNFQGLLKSWNQNSNFFSIILNMYFDYTLNHNNKVENKFLNLTQALEKLHRILKNGIYIDATAYKDSVYNPMVNSIPKDIPSNLRDSLKSRLKYGNEISLRNRLKELFEDSHLFKTLMINNSNDFIKRIVDTRNYLTHYEKDETFYILKDKELQIYTYKLYSFLKYQICKYFELKEDMIRRIILKDRDNISLFEARNS